MIRKPLNLLLIISLTCFIYACNSGSGGNNTNTQQIAAIQTLADNFVAKNKSESGLSAVSITAQCNGLNYGQPITVFSGTIGHGAKNQRPIQNDDEWQIGSNSKSFASVVLIQLASNPSYNFSLDDHIQKWITPSNYPQLQNLLRYNPTIRQMMNMTSGIPDDYNTQAIEFSLANQYTYESPVFWISFANSGPVVPAGTQWSYANTNYDIFNILVPLITGDSLKNEVTNRIIKPLKLQNTYFIDNLPTDDVDKSRLVKGYIFDSGNKKLYETSSWSLSSSPGSGSIISTTSDINTYYRNLYTTNKLLTASQLSTLSSFVSDLTGLPISSPSQSENGSGYGLGIGAWNLQLNNNYYKPQLGKNLIPLSDTNLWTHINNYNFVYTYSGGMLGFIFIYFYNPINNSSVVVGYNTYDLSDTQGYELPFDVLNYMDPICHE